MSHTEDARRVVAELDTKRSVVEERAKLLEGEREQITYDALTGDAEARKRLDQIGHELLLIEHELEAIRAAISEAGRRVEEAEGVAGAERAAERAKQALATARQLKDCAKAADKALASFLLQIHSNTLTSRAIM